MKNTKIKMLIIATISLLASHKSNAMGWKPPSQPVAPKTIFFQGLTNFSGSFALNGTCTGNCVPLSGAMVARCPEDNSVIVAIQTEAATPVTYSGYTGTDVTKTCASSNLTPASDSVLLKSSVFPLSTNGFGVDAALEGYETVTFRTIEKVSGSADQIKSLFRLGVRGNLENRKDQLNAIRSAKQCVDLINLGIRQTLAIMVDSNQPGQLAILCH